MNFKAVLMRARPYTLMLALAAIMVLAESLILLSLPLLAGSFTAELGFQARAKLGLICALVIALLAGQTVMRILHGAILTKISRRILFDLQRELYDHLQRLPIGFFQRTRQGELLALLAYDLRYLSDFITGTLINLVSALPLTLGAFILMIRIQPLLAWAAILSVPAFVLALKLLGRKVRPLSEGLRAAEGSALTAAEQNFAMLSVMKSFSREDAELERYVIRAQEAERLGTELGQTLAMLGPIIQFLASAAVVGLLWAAGDLVVTGDIKPSALISLLLYAALLTRPATDIADAWGQTQHARGALRQLDGVFQTTPEPLDAGKDPGQVKGAICYHKVSFSHQSRDLTLNKIDLEIRPGETIALVGHNGAGKTTLIDLLMRFYEPDGGYITLDGEDVRALNLRKLRQAIAVVPQNVLLFDGTVADNIRYGKPDCSIEDIERVLARAQALRFVMELPQRCDTLIGEQGVWLSGGERQRLALARALVKDPAVLVLDEATAMFDPESERAFVEDAQSAFAGKTVILISHRPTSLKLADRVVRLDRGRIVDIELRDKQGT